MNFITLYFCINFNFFCNVTFKRSKLYAVRIFFGMTERYYMDEGHSENPTIRLTSFMFLYSLHGLLELNPNEFLQF